MRLDDDSDEDGMKGEVQEGVELAIGLVEAAREPPQPPLAEEKKPGLSLEEQEAKHGKSRFLILVQPKINILSAFTHTHVDPNSVEL